MSNEDTTQVEFYAVWPNLGKKFSQQLGEIRTDTAHLSPLVRGMGLDAAGDFSTLEGIEKNAIQSREWGKQGFHNKFRMHYNKVSDLLDFAYNTGTEEVPNWYTTWSLSKDGFVTQQNTPTTASNLGVGAGIFRQKSGVDLELKSLRAFYPLSIRQQTNTIDFHSGAEANTYSSVTPSVPSGGTGGIESILADSGKVGVDFPFKAFEAGANAVITDTGNTIRFESTAQVVEFYGISVRHADDSVVFTEVHNIKLNVKDFYVTQETTNPSNKTIILNSRGDIFEADKFVEVAGDIMTGQLKMHDGTAGAPSIGFTNDIDTGMRLRGVADLAFPVAGTDRLRIQDDLILTAVPMQITNAGTVASPDYGFFPDIDTGIYQNVVADNSVAFTTGGKYAGSFEGGKLVTPRINAGHGEFYGYLSIAKGTATIPTLRFRNDPDTGIAGNDANLISFITGGVRAGWFDSNQDFNVPKQIIAGAGTKEAPGFTFDTDNADGFFLANTNSLVLSLNSVSQVQFQTTGTFFGTPIIFNSDAALHTQSETAPVFTFFADSNTGMYGNNADQLNFTTGGTRAGYFDANRDFFVTNQIYANTGDGTAGSPTYSFTDDPDTGMYTEVDNTLYFATGGNQAGWFDSAFNLIVKGNVKPSAGTENRPAHAFESDVDTGIYQNSSADGSIAFSTAGARAGYFDSNQDLFVTNELKVGDGSLSAPAYAFTSDTDTGLRLISAGNLRVVAAGVDIELWDVNSVVPLKPLRTNVVGTASVPAYSWFSDNNTGLYQNVGGDDSIAFTTAGTRAGYFDSSQNLHVTGDLITGGNIVHQGELHAPKVVAGTGEFYERVLLGAGLVGSPSLAFLEDTNTGLYQSATDTLDIAAGGVRLVAYTNTLIDNKVRQHIVTLGTLSNVDLAMDNDQDSGIMQYTTDNYLMTVVAQGKISMGSRGTPFNNETEFPSGEVLFTGGDVIVDTDVLAGRVHAGIGFFYTSLDVEGDLTIQGGPAAGNDPGGRLLLRTGDAKSNNFALSFDGDTDTGMFRSAADTIRFVCGGDEMLELTGASLKVLANQLKLDTGGGTVTAPVLTFNSDPNTGIYQRSLDTMAITTGGNFAGEWMEDGAGLLVENDIHTGRVIAGRGQFYGQVLFDEGTLAAPSISFSSDPDIGIWRNAAGAFQLVAGTSPSAYMTFGPGNVLVNKVLQLNKALQLDTTQDISNKVMYFTGDTDTGVYQRGPSGSGGNTWAWATAGKEAGWFDADQTLNLLRVESGFGNFYVDCRATRFFAHRNEPGGAGDFPGYSFSEDTDTGMYLDGVGDLRFTVGGVAKLAIQSGGVIPLAAVVHNAAGTATAPAYSWNADKNTGIYNVGPDDNIRFTTGGVEAGHFDAGQDLYVTNELLVPRVTAGRALFYTQVLIAGGHSSVPGLAFKDDPDTGIGKANVLVNTMDIILGGVVKWRWTTGNAQFVEPMRSAQNDASATLPDYGFLDDGNTGMWQDDAIGDHLHFTTGGVDAGFFDSSQNFHVTNSVIAGNDIRANAFYLGTTVHSSGISTNAAGDMVIDSGPNIMRFQTFNGDLVFNTVSGSSPGDMFFQSGASVDLTTANSGLMTITSDGFLDLTSSSQLDIESTGSSVRIQASTGVIVTDQIQGSQTPAASAPMYSFTGDTDTGMYRVSNNSLGFATFGKEAGRFDNGQDLYVTNELLVPRVTAGRGLFYEQILVGNGSKLNPSIAFKDDPDSGIYWRSVSGGPAFSLNNSDKAHFTSTYWMFTGTNVRFPNGTVTLPGINFGGTGSDHNTGLFQATAGDDIIRFSTGGTEAGRFDSTQNFHVTNDLRSSRVEAGLGVFYTALTVDGSLHMTDGPGTNLWTTGVSASTLDMTVAPGTQAEDTELKLDSQIKIWDSHIDRSATGTTVDILSDPTYTMTGPFAQPKSTFIKHAPTVSIAANVVTTMACLDESGTYTVTDIALGGLGFFNVFSGNPTLETTKASVAPLIPFVFNSTPTMLATDVDAGTLSGALPVSFRSSPTLSTTGSSGDLVIARYDAFKSEFTINAATAGGNAILGELNDFICLNSSTSGSGTNTLNRRINFYMEDDTQAVTQYGIYSTIKHGPGKRFINHTGGADSHHTGDFYIHSGLYADSVTSDYGTFYTRLKLNDREMKFGADGILYAYDLTRSKWLSVTRETIIFARNGTYTTDNWMSHSGGQVLSNNGSTAYEAYRDLTVLNIIAMNENCTVADTDLTLQKGDQSTQPNTVIATTTLSTSGLRESTSNFNLNIDVDATQWLAAKFLAATSGGSVIDPTLQVEIAWRLK